MSALASFGSHVPARDPQALAREILSQSRFRIHAQTPAARTWWDAVRDWLGDRWNQLLNAFSHHVRLGGSASTAIGDVLLAVIIVLVVVVLVRLLLSVARDGFAGAGDGISALAVPADPAALHQQARQAAQQGAYALAIALLFRASLAALDARGLLRDDPARTVNECRRDVRARAASLSGGFDCIARIFTAAVYAEDRVGAEQWNDAQRAYDEITAVRSDAA